RGRGRHRAQARLGRADLAVRLRPARPPGRALQPAPSNLYRPARHHVRPGNATADPDGNLTIVAPDLAINSQEGAWVEVYRWADGAVLGGIQGPPIGRDTPGF